MPVFKGFGDNKPLKAKNDNAVLVTRLQEIVDTSKDRSTLLTNLVVLIQKQTASSWSAGYKVAQEKYRKVK